MKVLVIFGRHDMKNILQWGSSETMYTYDAPAETQVGDFVRCPPSEFYEAKDATVMQIGSTYDGPTKRCELLK